LIAEDFPSPPVSSTNKTDGHDIAGLKLTTLVVIGTDCIGSFISYYHTITTTADLTLQKEDPFKINIIINCKAQSKHKNLGKMW
jgi:hypothetical protein